MVRVSGVSSGGINPLEPNTSTPEQKEMHAASRDIMPDTYSTIASNERFQRISEMHDPGCCVTLELCRVVIGLQSETEMCVQL